MSSIEEKKVAKAAINEETTGFVITGVLGNFLYGLLAIFVYLLICFIFSPTLLYAIQFLNEVVVKKNIKYGDYETFEQYFNDEVICGSTKNKDGMKTGCNPLPYDKRPLTQNLSEAFKSGVAKGFFASRDSMTSILKVLFNFLDFNNTLKPELFSSNTSPSVILENLTKLKNDRKVTGVIGKTLGTIVVLLWPAIYYSLWIVSLLWGFSSSILTFFTTLNKYTLVKTALIFGWPIVFWWLFMIPPMLSLITFIVIVSLLFMSLFMVSFGSSIYNMFNISTSFYWLPNWVNNYFTQIINNKSGKDKQRNMNTFNKVKFEGVEFEWPAHAKEFSNIYYFIFVISNIINLLINFVI